MVNDPGGRFGVAVTQLSQAEFVLYRKLLAVSGRIGGDVLDSLRLKEMYDHARRELVVGLEAYVLTEQLPPETATGYGTVMVRVPSGWWQHFKHQFAKSRWLGWLARWRPVVFHSSSHKVECTVNLERWRQYPAAPNMGGGLGEPVRMHTLHWQYGDTVVTPDARVRPIWRE